MKKKKLTSSMLTGLLGALGFMGCDGVGSGEDMYGCPIVDFQVKGSVASEDRVPLEGIQVVVRTAWDNLPDEADTVYTDCKGEFISHELSAFSIGNQKVYFNDVDGEQQGGTYKSDSIALEKMEKKQLEKGKGWYDGKYEFKGAIKLAKKDNKPESSEN